MHYVYILKSQKDGNLYTGATSDLKRRYVEHVDDKVESTRHRRPFKLICYEAYLDKETAESRERFLKTSDGKKDIKRRLKFKYSYIELLYVTYGRVAELVEGSTLEKCQG